MWGLLEEVGRALLFLCGIGLPGRGRLDRTAPAPRAALFALFAIALALLRGAFVRCP